MSKKQSVILAGCISAVLLTTGCAGSQAHSDMGKVLSKIADAGKRAGGAVMSGARTVGDYTGIRQYMITDKNGKQQIFTCAPAGVDNPDSLPICPE
jgi:hypothetical protein